MAQSGTDSKCNIKKGREAPCPKARSAISHPARRYSFSMNPSTATEKYCAYNASNSASGASSQKM